MSTQQCKGPVTLLSIRETYEKNKGEFRSLPISAFVYILALSQSERVNREIYKQAQAVTFELRCKWICNIFS
jgi:hypothetical protein